MLKLLIARYWRFHVKSAVTVGGVIALIAMSVFLSTVLSRQSLRMMVYRGIEWYGNFNAKFADVDEAFIDRLCEAVEVERLGRVFVCGKATNGGDSYTCGYLENADSSDLMNFGMNMGRLPERSGEIALEENVLGSFNIIKRLGNTVTLRLADENGDYSEERSFTLVGVIRDMSRRSNTDISSPSGFLEGFPDPMIYVSREDGEEIGALCTNVNIIIRGSDNGEADFSAIMSDELLMSKLAGFDGRAQSFFYMTEAYRADMENTSGDSQLIKWMGGIANDLFFGCAAIISSIAACAVIATVMRKRSQSLERAQELGMSVALRIKVCCIEAALFTIAGTAAGILLGIGINELLLLVQERCFGIKAFRGYFVEKAIERSTDNPFVMASVLALIVSVAAFSVGIAYSFRKAKKKSRAVKRGESRSISGNRLLKKALRIRLIFIAKVITAAVCVVSVTWTLVLCSGICINITGVGSTLFYQKSDYTDSRSSGFQYTAQRQKNSDYFSSAMLATNYEKGLNDEDIAAISDAVGVNDFFCRITDLTARVLIPISPDTQTLRDKLSTVSLRKISELSDKVSEEAFGVKTDSAVSDFVTRYGNLGIDIDAFDVYAIPIIAVNDEYLELLSASVQLDVLDSGGAVALEVNGKSPFEVGEKLEVINTCAVGEYSNITKEACIEQTVDSKLMSSEIEIAAIATQKDERLSELMKVNGLASDNPVCFVMSVEGYRKLGFSQKYYDLVGVSLEEGADIMGFETLFASRLTSEKGIGYTSIADGTVKMYRQVARELFCYITIVLMLVVIFAVGWVGLCSAERAVKRRTIARLNNIGLDTRAIAKKETELQFLPLLLGISISVPICVALKLSYRALYIAVIEHGSDYADTIVWTLANRLWVSYQFHDVALTPILLAAVKASGLP